MTLSDVSIKNPVFAWMLMIGLIAFGALAFLRLGVGQFPDIDYPVVSVSIGWEGAAPEVMETEITDVIEDAIMGVEGVNDISSVSRQGQSSLTIEFDLERDIDVAVQDIQARIAQAQRSLPKDVDPAVIRKSNPEDHPIMWVSVYGEQPVPLDAAFRGRRSMTHGPLPSGSQTTRDLMAYVRDHLKDQFTALPGVGEVFLGGYVEPNLRVWLDADKMRAYELTVDDVARAIESQHTEVPAGRIETGRQEMNIRVMGEARSVKEFSQLIIPERRGSPIWKPVRIGDVATVEDGLADVRRISRTSGVPSVGMGIRKQRGANTVAVARAARERVMEIRKVLPEGLQIDVVFDRSRFIEDSNREILFNLGLSALVTSIICWLFLGRFSSALNVVLAIPTSVVGAFTVIYFMGFTLNTFTLLALSLSIGIVVDDAIMVLENIVRHREMGKSRVKAALIGAREITFAAMAVSISLLAIFVPVIFMEGIIGKFLFQFGISLSVAIMLSLLEALTLAPMRCSQFLEVGHSSRIGRIMDLLMKGSARVYGRALAVCLRGRWAVVAAGAAVFAGSLYLGKGMNREFVPAQDEGRILVRVQTPLGSSIELTDEVTRKVEDALSARGEVLRYFAAVGGFGGSEANTAMLFVTLKPRKERGVQTPFEKPPTQQEFIPVVRRALSGLPGIQRVAVQDLSQGGFGARRGFPVELSVRGPDWDTLAQSGGLLAKRMEETGLMVDVDTDFRQGMPEVRVVPDRAKAAERGVNIATIAQTINATVGGVRVGKYTREGRRYDIRVRLVERDRRRPEDISRIWVRNNRGELARLSDVVQVRRNPTLLSINRKDRERAVSVFANLAPGASQADAIRMAQGAARDVLPEGYKAVLSGSAETFAESFQSLIFALVMGIFVAYMVLASQFRSFIHPVTVLLALPFSVSGALLAMRLAGISMNIYSMIGVILLMGIVKKNSILLVDFTNARRRQGKGVKEALLEACPIRFRPIVMTSLSTVGAALPLALALGPGSEIVRPMAVVVIGGVLFSTLLTLFVVPCAYSLLSVFESRRHEDALREALAELGEGPGRAG